ncbi:hypothetical protein GE107_15210 [Cohnella sp. CFH 77786]|uniref:YhcN/YlaJ family sporulation lipoprotein n=1 Tax=Cohnella sp. CFH 77786 TaxID=2662265 RepID=UPI001C60AC9D|nr:YhcN/YlaJ family sporulation lipoprotein [Cohnella sp. CFH 77786]MBW5447405.1 hypothetical protein [Cohnella sp. CFH 77786]
MRKSFVASMVLLSAALAVAGCVNDKTGDVGQKNLRPNHTNDYVNHRLSINGTHSYGSRTYPTRFASDQANEQNRRMGGNRLNNNIVGVHDNYHLRTNDRIARELAAMPEVDAAYVLLTDHNAYVGITEKRAGGIAPQSADAGGRLKDKIADRVKAMAPAVQNVYVTANPEFVGRVRYYNQAAGAGHPVQEYLTEFNALVTRIFPATAASGTTGNGTDLSADTGMDTGTGRSPSALNRFGTYGTHRAYGPLGTTGFR